MVMELEAGTSDMESTANLTKLSLGRDRRDLSSAMDVGRGREAGRLSVTSRGGHNGRRKRRKKGVARRRRRKRTEPRYIEMAMDAFEPRAEQRDARFGNVESRGWMEVPETEIRILRSVQGWDGFGPVSDRWSRWAGMFRRGQPLPVQTPALKAQAIRGTYVSNLPKRPLRSLQAEATSEPHLGVD